MIVTWGTPAARAAKQETSKIPIVMAAIADPIGTDVVQSVARPGGNITGVTSIAIEIDGKRLEFLRVCPGTLGGVAELSQHQADGSETQKGKRLAVEIFPILGQPAAAVEPGEGALDNPAFG